MVEPVYFDLGRAMETGERIKSSRQRRQRLQQEAKRADEIHSLNLEQYNMANQMAQMELAKGQQAQQMRWQNVARDKLWDLSGTQPKGEGNMWESQEEFMKAINYVDSTVPQAGVKQEIAAMAASPEFQTANGELPDWTRIMNAIKTGNDEYGASLTKKEDILKLSAGEKAFKKGSGGYEVVAEGADKTSGKATDFDKVYSQEVAIAKELGLPVPTRKQLKKDMSSAGGLTEGSVLSSLDDFELMNDIPAGEAHKEYLRLRKDDGLERSEALVQAKENISNPPTAMTFNPETMEFE